MKRAQTPPKKPTPKPKVLIDQSTIDQIVASVTQAGLSAGITGLVTIGQMDATSLQMYGVPKQYIAAFLADINPKLKSGVYSGSKIDTSKLQTAIEASAGKVAGRNAGTIVNAIKTFFGITKDTTSTSNGWGRLTTGITTAGGVWAVASSPGMAGAPKVVGAVVPPKTTGTPSSPGGVSAQAAAEANAKASAQISAYDSVLNTLDAWGMAPKKPEPPANKNDAAAMAAYNQQLQAFNADESIIGTVKNMVFGASTQQVNTKVLLDYVRGTAAYQAAFPGLTERNTKQDLAQHMTEQDYMNYVSSIHGTAQQYGIAELDNKQIAALVQNDVSAAEFNERVTKGYTAAMNADPATRAQLAKFGVNTSDLASYYLDPKNSLPKIEQATAAATLAGYSQNVGLRGMSESGARELADRVNLGAGSAYGTMSMTSAQNALLGASRDVQLTAAAPGSGRETVTTDQLIGSQVAGYGGTNQIAEQVQVARAEQSATQQFSKGGGYAESGRGVSGLGSAKS